MPVPAARVAFVIFVPTSSVAVVIAIMATFLTAVLSLAVAEILPPAVSVERLTSTTTPPEVPVRSTCEIPRKLLLTFDTTLPSALAARKIPPLPLAVKVAACLLVSVEPMVTPTDFSISRSTDKALTANTVSLPTESSNAETSMVTSVSSVAETVMPPTCEVSSCAPAPISTRDVDDTVPVATNSSRLLVFSVTLVTAPVTRLIAPASTVTPSETTMRATVVTLGDPVASSPVKSFVPLTCACAKRLTVPVA